ncbi:hypothetical protein BDV25DRAFT_139562 [Aspergillus avenaceus]|uniref:Heterokaryon incompatibility domain-containing protein n=1 Tax=Aspergillus avenaceus TaxID=36643 RepID=A0A5N6TWH7_ASPAV|nr:hypothetical protein BDV25DRAFT_139562 [Aspergillus avenaceus]
MRLINTETFLLEEFFDEVPQYAILSHIWGNDKEEVSSRDVMNDRREKAGWFKLESCCNRALKDGLKYAWVDTCCVDNTNSVELGEAINCMFRWYRNAASLWSQLSSSRWFQSGWTLQELLAPRNIVFYDSEWHAIGSKTQLSSTIAKITGIPRPFLLGISHLTDASIAQRMSWASKRQTKRKEGIAYCLLGLFGVMMPIIHGEGEQAFARLQRQITESTNDDSIFAWGLGLPESEEDDSEGEISAGVFASSPADFANCGHIAQRNEYTASTTPFTIDGGCVRINLPLHTTTAGRVFGLLNCGPERNSKEVVGIPLRHMSNEPSAQPLNIRTGRQKRKNRAKYQDWFYIEDTIEAGLELIEVEPESRWRRDYSLIETANDSVDDIAQETWARFRPDEEGSSDFVVLLEFETQGEQRRARGHLMVADKPTPLSEIVKRSSEIRHMVYGKESANNGTFSILLTVEQDIVAGQEMFVVNLARTNDVPDVTVHAMFESAVLETKEFLDNAIISEETLREEEERLIRQAEDFAHTLELARGGLAVVNERIDKLNEEKAQLTKQLEMGSVHMNQISDQIKGIREKRAELSEQVTQLGVHFRALEPDALANGYHSSVLQASGEEDRVPDVLWEQEDTDVIF